MALCLIFFLFGGYFVLIHRSNWRSYTNTSPSFSFSYPTAWGEPRVYNNQVKSEFSLDFGNYAFSVNNGYYFSSVGGKRPTVLQLVQSYQDDMNNKNEVKDFQTDYLKIDGHYAIRVNVDTLTGDHHTDIYIYEDQVNQDKFILITADRSFVDDKTLNNILSMFKL